ncbi:TRAP transporter substrate-binding protein DctP [Nitrospirota bacterium]
MSRLIHILIIVLAAVFFCTNISEAKVIKLATIAPEGSSWMTLMRAGAKEIKQRTQGRVKIKFYTGGVMGNEKSVLRKIRIGQLHGGAFTSSGLSAVYPDIYLYGLPMEIQSYEEADYVRGKMDDLLMEGLRKAGFESFGLAEGGFAMVMSGSPVKTLDDLKGKKVWVPEGDKISYTVMRSLGLAPVTLSITDVLPGLEAGLIDIVAVSPVGAITFQWHTKLTYFTDTRLLYIYATLVIDRRVFSKLNPSDQTVVTEVFGKTYEELNRINRADSDKATKVLEGQGLKRVTQSPEQRQEWYRKSRPAIEGLVKDGVVSERLYNMMIDIIRKYRNESAGQ